TDLASVFDEIERRTSGAEEEAKARSDREGRKDKEDLAKSVLALCGRKAAIARGEDLRALEWVWERVSSRESFGRIDLKKLNELVGSNLAADVVTGFKACWRAQDVSLPEPREGTPTTTVLGLTGL